MGRRGEGRRFIWRKSRLGISEEGRKRLLPLSLGPWDAGLGRDCVSLTTNVFRYPLPKLSPQATSHSQSTNQRTDVLPWSCSQCFSSGSYCHLRSGQCSAMMEEGQGPTQKQNGTAPQASVLWPRPPRLWPGFLRWSHSWFRETRAP